MSRIVRKDDNNHIIPGLFGLLSQKTVVYDAEAVSAQATLVVAPGGTNDELTFTAVPYGAAGNDISIEYLDPETEDAELAISVSGNVIVFSLATDSNGDITTTADELKTALLADADASALVTAADSGGDDGSGVLAAVAADVTAGGAGRTLFEVTGNVMVQLLLQANDDLTGSGTIAVGNSDDNDYLIDPEAVTAIDTDEFLQTNGTSSKILSVNTGTFFLCSNDIRDLVATNTITGSITYHLFWYPLSEDGNVEVTNE